VLEGYDVYARARGNNRAIAEICATHADGSGRIEIAFERVKDEPTCSGIEVFGDAG